MKTPPEVRPGASPWCSRTPRSTTARGSGGCAAAPRSTFACSTSGTSASPSGATRSSGRASNGTSTSCRATTASSCPTLSAEAGRGPLLRIQEPRAGGAPGRTGGRTPCCSSATSGRATCARSPGRAGAGSPSSSAAIRTCSAAARPGSTCALALGALYSQFACFLYVGAANREYFEAFGVPRRKLFFAPHSVNAELFNRDDPGHMAQAQTGALANSASSPATRVVLFAGKLVAARSSRWSFSRPSSTRACDGAGDRLCRRRPREGQAPGAWPRGAPGPPGRRPSGSCRSPTRARCPPATCWPTSSSCRRGGSTRPGASP